MDLEALLVGLVTGLELLDDVGLAGRSKERWQPVVMLDDLVRYHSCRDLARPTHDLGHPKCALPVGVLLTAERRGARVRPAVFMRAVVGGIHHDGVLGDTQLV